MPAGEVVVSASALALFTTMMSAVVGALVGMFYLAWREKQRSYDELKAGYDARYADMKAERDRLLQVQAQTDRDTLALLAVVKDGVVSMTASAGTLTSEVASLRRAVEQQQRYER